MTDYTALRTRIADELFASTFAASGFTAQINREINSAIKHYETTRTRFNEVRDWTVATTVAGTRTYSLTSNFLKMDTLKLRYNDSFIILKFITWDQMEEEDRQITATQGVPEWFTIYAETLRLFPVPNGSYTLQGSYIRSYSPVSLTGSATTTASANASHGWLDQGEEVIRNRARAAVEILYLKKPEALLELQALQAQNRPYFCRAEEIAFKALMDETGEALSTGLLRPYRI